MTNRTSSLDSLSVLESIKLLLWFNFTIGSYFIFLCFKLIINITINKNIRKQHFEPLIKLTHNTYITWENENLSKIYCRRPYMRNKITQPLKNYRLKKGSQKKERKKEKTERVCSCINKNLQRFLLSILFLFFSISLSSLLFLYTRLSVCFFHFVYDEETDTKVIFDMTTGRYAYTT